MTIMVFITSALKISANIAFRPWVSQKGLIAEKRSLAGRTTTYFVFVIRGDKITIRQKCVYIYMYMI